MITVLDQISFSLSLLYMSLFLLYSLFNQVFPSRLFKLSFGLSFLVKSLFFQTVSNYFQNSKLDLKHPINIQSYVLFRNIPLPCRTFFRTPFSYTTPLSLSCFNINCFYISVHYLLLIFLTELRVNPPGTRSSISIHYLSSKRYKPYF